MSSKEYWKPIDGYFGIYEVSNFGRVRRIKDGSCTNVGKILKPQKRCAYLSVTLYDRNHNPKTISLHRLVALSFCDNPEGKPQVNHIDGNKYNNYATNLEWVTSQENNKHASDTGLAKWWIGLNKANLKNGRKVRCKETGIVYDNQREAGKKLGIDESGICKACRGKYETAGSYHWEYV